jgi:hypothetical protein
MYTIQPENQLQVVVTGSVTDDDDLMTQRCFKKYDVMMNDAALDYLQLKSISNTSIR